MSLKSLKIFRNNQTGFDLKIEILRFYRSNQHQRTNKTNVKNHSKLLFNSH